MADAHTTEPLLEIGEILSILNEISLFGGLSDKQLYTIFKLLERSHYQKGEFIFEVGDEPSHIYIVWKGRVTLLLKLDDSYLEKLTFNTGQCFGETAAIAIQPHTASAIASENTELIILPRTAFHSIWETDKELFGMLMMNVAREACRRLNQTDEILLHYFAGRK